MAGRRIGLTLLVLGALALSGCAGTSQAGSDEGGASVVDAPTAAPAPSASPSEPATTAPAASASPIAGVYVDYSDGAIEETAGAKVLFFHAPWCPKCRALDEQLLAEGAPDGLTVFKVDFDSRTDLRQRYGVTLQTTVVYVDDAGDPLSVTVLYDDPSIESLIDAAP